MSNVFLAIMARLREIKAEIRRNTESTDFLAFAVSRLAEAVETRNALDLSCAPMTSEPTAPLPASSAAGPARDLSGVGL